MNDSPIDKHETEENNHLDRIAFMASHGWVLVSHLTTDSFAMFKQGTGYKDLEATNRYYASVEAVAMIHQAIDDSQK